MCIRTYLQAETRKNRVVGRKDFIPLLFLSLLFDFRCAEFKTITKPSWAGPHGVPHGRGELSCQR